MDDHYTEPKDAVGFMLASHQKSPLHTNFYSDEEDDDDEKYTKPYNPFSDFQATGQNNTKLHGHAEDIYEISDSPAENDDKTLGNSCSFFHPVEYNHLNNKKMSDIEGIKAGDYSPTQHWQGRGQKQAVPQERKVSPGRERGLQRSGLVYKEKRPSPVRRGEPLPKFTLARDSSPNDGQGQRGSATNSQTPSPDVSGSAQKRFSRQRVIYPRQSANSSDIESPSPTVQLRAPQFPTAPPMYEEGWDSPNQQKKLMDNVRAARCLSTTSDDFQDALEYLPEDWSPMRPKAVSCSSRHVGNNSGTNSSSSTSRSSVSSERDIGRTASGRSRTVDPVTGGAYEQAWDLNKSLEEKLRSIQMMQHEPAGEAGEGENAYMEPWDTAKKQQELEAKIQQARSAAAAGSTGSNVGSGRGSSRSSSGFVPSSSGGVNRSSSGGVIDDDSQRPKVPKTTPKPEQQRQSPKEEQQQASKEDGSGKGASNASIYEDAWDTRQSLSKLLQRQQSRDSGSDSGSTGASAQLPSPSHHAKVLSGSLGEPINAMIPLQNQDWYHANISRDDAERILRVCKVGSYLIRDSSDRCHYTLSIKSPNQIIHIQIDQCRKPDGSMRYILGKNSKAFQTVPAMIDHYTQHAVPIHGAEHMRLLHPVQCHWSRDDDSTA